jgi:hypothetical protein
MSAIEAVTAEPQARRTPEEEQLRRTEALSLRLAGMSFHQIADRMEITDRAARLLVQTSLTTNERHVVNELREIENQRLDRAQAAIWTQVLQGDLKSIGMFLRISGERSKLNGLYAPQKLDISMSIRQEMEQALNELEEIVLLPVLEDGEVRHELLDDTGWLDEGPADGEAGGTEGSGLESLES